MRSSGRPPGLAGNASWMMAGLGLRLVTQAGYFLLIARGLGADGYGAFIGVVALVAIAAPFATWGSGNVMIKNVARRPETFPIYWARALITTAVSGTALVAVVVGVARFALPASIPLGLVGLVAASDLLFGRLVDVSGHAFQAVERLRRTAMIQLLPALAKLAGALAILWSGADMTVLRWGTAYLAATMLGAAVATALVHRELGRPASPNGAGTWELREGFYFSISLSAQTIYNDIDKTMLARIATLEAAGIYAAAYRVVDVAVTPLRSLLSAAYARFFRHGEDGMRESLRFARRLLPAGVAYGLASGAGLWLAAPWLARILGDGFPEVDSALRWLAVLPLLKVLSSLPADAMTGADRQGTRSAIQVGVAAFNVALSVWLIAAYSWRGAAWASLASDGLLAGTLWIAVWMQRPRSTETPVRVLEPTRA